MSAVLELSHLVKDYRGLRPLRIDQFALGDAEQTAILGLDRPAAETLINLITGAALPDSGDIRVFGRRTADITDSADWLAVVDRFGIVTERAVLLDGSDGGSEPRAAVFARHRTAVRRPPLEGHRRWRDEVGLARGRLGSRRRDRSMAWIARGCDWDARWRSAQASCCSNMRPLALSGSRWRRSRRRSAARRPAATSPRWRLGADPEFAAAVADRVLTLDPATGRLAARRRRWFM